MWKFPIISSQNQVYIHYRANLANQLVGLRNVSKSLISILIQTGSFSKTSMYERIYQEHFSKGFKKASTIRMNRSIFINYKFFVSIYLLNLFRFLFVRLFQLLKKSKHLHSKCITFKEPFRLKLCLINFKRWV